MKRQYELTVIISCYNQERYLSETIGSVFDQKVSFPFKVIITDDNSCLDRSKDVIQDQAEKHADIYTIFAEQNGGYLRNIMRALEKTDTKYFCLLDADDYWTDPYFLQRAYEYMESHDDYSVYESNVEVIAEDGRSRHLFISSRNKAGTYSKEMLLNNRSVPVTQTTGMFLRNCIFINGIPEVMERAVGTRSERSFEGDTGRFMMHLKYGPAYYDSRVAGVYRLTEDGIWNSLSAAKKQLIAARMQSDYHQYYGSDVDFFVNRAYKLLQAYLFEKQKELDGLDKLDEFIDEYEKLMLDDVYGFCKQYENKIVAEKNRLRNKIRQIVRILRA